METECVICLEKLIPNGTGDDVTNTLECNHTYHDKCIQEWIKNSKAANKDSIWFCPLCRAEQNVRINSHESEIENVDIANTLMMIKFKNDRGFIMFVTMTHIIFGFFSFIFITSHIAVFQLLFSLYGYRGALMLETGHLTCYVGFCVMMLLSTICRMIIMIMNINMENISFDIQNTESEYVYHTITIVILSYIIIIVRRMCSNIHKYNLTIHNNFIISE